MLQKNNVKITDLHSWVLSKYLLENVSDQGITNLRIKRRFVFFALLNHSQYLSASPSVEAKGSVASSSQDGLPKYVISIAASAPKRFGDAQPTDPHH